MNSNFDDLLKFYKSSLETYEKLEKYYKFNEIDSIAKSKVKKLTKKYLVSNERKYLRDINKYEHIREVLNKKKINGKQIEQITSVINYLDTNQTMTGGSTPPSTPSSRFSHYTLWQSQKDQIIGDDSLDMKLNNMMNRIREQQRTSPSIELIWDLRNQITSMLGKERAFLAFNPKFKIVRHKELFEQSEGITSGTIIEKYSKNTIIPSLLFPYYLYFDINKINSLNFEYAFVSFNESNNDINNAVTFENIALGQKNQILGIENFNYPVTNPAIPPKPTGPLGFSDEDDVIVYQFNNKNIIFGKYHDKGAPSIRFERDTNYTQKNLGDLGEVLINKLIDYKSVEGNIKNSDILKFYIRKLDYIEKCSQRIKKVKEYYERLPNDSKLIKNFIINYEFKVRDKQNTYTFGMDSFLDYSEQFKRFYEDPNKVNLDNLKKALTTDGSSNEDSIYKNIEEATFRNVAGVMKSLMNNIFRPSPTGASKYNTDFLRVKQFDDIFQEIEHYINGFDLARRRADFNDFYQSRMGSTNVADFNKNYMDELTHILSQFTELMLLIFNEINLLFSIDHEQTEKLDAQIRYIHRRSKVYRQQIIQSNYDTLRNAIGNRNSSEKVYIPKDAFQTYNINIQEERDAYRDIKKRCTFGSRKNDALNREKGSAFRSTDTTADLLAMSGGSGSYTAKIPDSVRQIIAKQQVQLRRIQIMKDIYQRVLDQLGNYVVPENIVGDTYYTTIKYKSTRLYNGNPVYVFCGPAIDSNPNMTQGKTDPTDPDFSNRSKRSGPRASQGICAWFTTDETFYQDDNAIIDKLAVDSGFDYAGRIIDDTWDKLFDKIESASTTPAIKSTIFTDGVDIIPDSISPKTLLEVTNPNTDAALNPLRNGTDADKHFLKIWAPYIYNLTKSTGDKLTKYTDDLLTEFPIDLGSLVGTSPDRPKVIYTSQISRTYSPMTGSTDPNTYDRTVTRKFYNNPHTLAHANDIGPLSDPDGTQKILNGLTVYDPLQEIDKFWDQVIIENPLMGPENKPIDVNFHEFKGDNLLNPALLTRFTNARIRRGLLSEDTPGVSFKGPIANLVNELNIFDSEPIKYQFCQLLSWLMGLENGGNELPNEFVSADDATENYYRNNRMQFNGKAEYTYKFYHEGFEYLKDTTNDREAKYLNDGAWDQWDIRMTNQKTYFKKLAPTGPPGPPNEIRDLETLRDVIIASFGINVDKLDLGNPTPTGGSRGEDKLDLILNMIPIGLTQFYNRRKKVDNDGTDPNFLDDYAYLHGKDSIPPSPPITYAYDNLDNVIGDVAFRLFRHHNTKNVYFTTKNDPAITIKSPFVTIQENSEFANRDIWKLGYFLNDKLPKWNIGNGNHDVTPISVPGHMSPPKFGRISQRTESFTNTTGNFKYGFNSVFKILFNFVSGYFQTKIQNLKTATEIELDVKEREIRNILRIDASGNMITEKAKIVLENLEKVLSDNTKINTLNVKIQVYNLVEELDEIIARVRNLVIHSSTLNFLLDNSFRNDNYMNLWEDEFRFCFDKLIFLFFDETLDQVNKFNATFDDSDSGLDARARSLSNEVDYAIRLRFVQILDQYKYPFELITDLFNEIKVECCRAFQKARLFKNRSELQKILKLFWQQKNNPDDFDYNSLDETDKGFFNTFKDLPIEINDGTNTYNLTIQEIYENFNEINWYNSFPGANPTASVPVTGPESYKRYIPDSSALGPSGLDQIMDNEKFTFKAKSIKNGEFGDTTEKTFTFRNAGGSDDFEGKYVIFNIENVKFENHFNFFILLPILQRLLLLFLTVGSTKFRVYALINDIEILDAPLPTGTLIYDKRQDLMQKGMPTPTQTKIQAQPDKSGYLDKYYILQSSLGDTNKKNKNLIKFRRDYGSDVDEPDINPLYMHDFKLEESVSSKDNLDAFLGYNEWRIFDRKGDLEDDKRTLTIQMAKCKELIKKYTKNILSTEDDLSDINDDTEITLQKGTAPGYPTTVEKHVIAPYIGGATNEHIKKTYQVTTGPHKDAYFPNAIDLEDTDSRLDQLNNIYSKPIEEIKFSNIYSDETPEELSQQMLLVTKLKLGTGVKIVMQGYSGTGKSFSLFGGGGKPGIVQSVIDQMDSPSVYMRIYEMYGYALPYDFYFEKDPLFYIFAHDFDNALNYRTTNKIFRKNERETYINAFSDSENTGGPDERPSSIVNLGAENIQNYIEVSKDELINLSRLLEDIEKERKNGYEGRYKTIKPTKNNPESSRSIILIEFKIEVEGKFIPMVLVDMPGREDIKKSYDYSIQPKPGSNFFGNPKELSDLKNLIFWNPIFLVQIEAVRRKLYEIISNLPLPDFKRLVKRYINTINSLKDTINHGLTDGGGMDCTDILLFYIGIDSDNQTLQFMRSSDLDVNVEPFYARGRYNGKLLIEEIKKRLDASDEDFTDATYNSLQASVKILASNIDNFHVRTFNKSPNYDKLKENLRKSISMSVCLLLFVDILKLPDFESGFDIVFQLILSSLAPLGLDLDVKSGETPKDVIMKSYEGIFINENINGIMFNLLKEHPKFPKNTVKGLQDLYDENTDGDNDCAPHPKALYKQHKMLEINDKSDGTLGKFIQEKINDSYDNKNFDNDTKYFFDFVKGLNGSPNIINYCANEIFYLRKRPAPTGMTLPATLENRTPMIEDVLSVYLNKPGNNKFLHCSDFTFLIVIANYLGHQKCNEQIKLLMDMKRFIETVTSE